MKKLMTILVTIIFAYFILTGCSNKVGDNSKTPSNNKTAENAENSTSGSSSTDCDEFIKGYEKFAEKYIVFMKKMKEHPNDLSALTEYAKMITEVGEWVNKAKNCATDPKFTARLSEIQAKMDKALENAQ